MTHYILQTVVFQLFFLIIYDVFLKKETFFNWNRCYLIVTAIASMVLPFIKIASIRTIVSDQFVIRLPEVVIGDVQPMATNLPIASTSEISTVSNFIWSWDYLLYAGMILTGLIFIYKIFKISNFIQKNPKRWKNNVVIVSLLKSNAAFSFFNYIFLGEWLKAEEKETILKHELVHVAQKHSLDLLLFEVLRIVFWFNPLIYMYQNRITHLHEYIADAKVMGESDKQQYYEKLLSQVFETESISFSNTFFNQSLIKKRIVMLSKSKSNRIHLLKYALLIPLISGMLIYTSSYAQKVPIKNTQSQDITLDELVELYYLELFENDRVGNSKFELYKEYSVGDTKYIKTKEELARSKAFFKYISKLQIEKKSANNSLDDETINGYQKMLDLHKTYDEYLDYKKTDEAKTTWESNSRNGVLRLFVEDMKNKTEKEKDKQQEKIDLILTDEYFHSIIITDGKSSLKTEFEKPKKVEEERIFESYDIEVPFSVIEEVPTIEECKDLATNDEKRQCLSDFISDFVNNNFNITLAKELDLKGRQRIMVLFKIGNDGNIKEVMARAQHPALEVEAKRVISKLPQMIPGKQKGIAVVVPYSLPILFQVQENVNITEISPETYYETNGKEIIEVPFSVIEEAPTFEACKDLANKDEIRMCTSKIITNFIYDNFNKKLGKELGLKGQQRITTIFKISKDGTIDDIKVRAPHPALEAEAKRVIASLPQMIPGKHKGKNVVVPYSLPILFEVSE